MGTLDAGATDSGPSLVDASLDGTTRTDAAPVDSGVCCAPAAIWNASDGLLPNVDCPRWSGVNTAPANPTLASSGVTFSTSANGQNQYFMHTASDLFVGGDTVRIHFRMKLISSSSSVNSRSGAGIAFAFGPNRRKNFVFVEDGQIFVNSAENTRGASAAVLTTDAMHDYVVDVDVLNSTVKVSYDGTPTLSGALFVTATDTTTDYILWGEGSIYAYGTSVWETFEHDAWYPCPPPA